jgi:putative transposase
MCLFILNEVRKLLKSFKTEINPTLEQRIKINKTIGTCRFIYNFFIAHNKKLYENNEKFISANEFSKWLNNEFLPNNPDYMWIKEVSTASTKQSMIQANTAYTRFFKHLSNFPRFKKKHKSNVKMYFVRSGANSTIQCERHRIKIPTLGWVRIKEKGYIPTTKSGYIIRSGTVSMEAERYYVSVLVDVDTKQVNLTILD